MCYVTLLPVTIGHSGPVFVSVEYPAWASSYSFQYSISCWKPPNAA